MSIRLGKLNLIHGIALAPMAGFSDRAMRQVCHSLGAEYSVTEMISAKATVYGDKKTARLARISEREGPVGLQIFGSEPSVMAEAAGILSHPTEGTAPVAIDINMGCPVPKIYNNGEGSALMKNPALIHDIVKATAKATELPVTVKIRLGVDREHLNAVECAIAAEEGGAAAITVHGRTRVEMYSGKADIKAIADVKKNLHIPLFANGDITTAKEGIEALRTSGADGIMIGRGAVGNPYLFAELKAALRGEAYTPPTLSQRADLALWQLRLAIEDKGEEAAVLEARKQVALYFRAFRGAAELRAAINRAVSYDQVASAFTALIDNNQNSTI